MIIPIEPSALPAWLPTAPWNRGSRRVSIARNLRAYFVVSRKIAGTAREREMCLPDLPLRSEQWENLGLAPLPGIDFICQGAYS